MSMTALIAAFALAAGPQPRTSCRHDRPETCTIYEIYSPSLDAQVMAMLGRVRAEYLFKGSLLDQQSEVMSLPASGPDPVGDYYIVTGCRLHSCSEKGAMLLSRTGVLEATAILHFNCAIAGDLRCLNWAVLTVFVRDPKDARILKSHLLAWAEALIATENRLYADPDNGPRAQYLRAVEVYAADNGKPRPISRESVGEIVDLPASPAPH